MRGIERLTREHRQIKGMLAILEGATARIARGGGVPVTLLEGAIQFFDEFASSSHAGREEAMLFPALRRHGLGPETSVIQALLQQHETAQVHLRHMRAAVERLAQGDHRAAEPFVDASRAYSELLREHIRIEDDYLYPLAAATLSAAEADALGRQLDAAERPAGRYDRHALCPGHRESLERWRAEVLHRAAGNARRVH